jgi:hypothetical protein
MNKFTVAVAAFASTVLLVAVGLTAASLASADTSLAQVRSAPTIPPPGVHALAFAAPNPSATFTTVTPCRIVNTIAGGGALGNGASRSFYVAGTFGFAPQGGKSGGCGIPVGATAIAATITAANSSAHGYLRAYPTGSAEPNATILSYPVFGGNTGTTIPVNPGSALGLRFTNHGGPTHLIIDVTGYYDQQLAAFISPSGGIYTGTSRVVAASRLTDPGVYEVRFDRDIRYCSSTASAYYYGYFASTDSYGASDTSVVRVRLFNATGAPVNGYFSLNVSC